MKTDNGINQNLKSLNTENTKLDVLALLLHTQKSNVCKLQQKTVGSVSLEKLKKFAEAVGGEFSAQIKLPNGEIVTI